LTDQRNIGQPQPSEATAVRHQHIAEAMRCDGDVIQLKMGGTREANAIEPVEVMHSRA